MDALRAARSAGAGISCSIDPTEEGLVRLQRLLTSRGLSNDEQTVRRMEEAVGPQEITVTGVTVDGHFSRVMVAADLVMKRLAMGFEKSPVADMPSYLEMLPANARRRRSTVQSPRWWLSVNYDAMLASPDGLAWQLRGPGLKALTAAGNISATGRLVNGHTENPLAERWAQSMTKNYPQVATSLPVLAELRNCMDLAVIAALITKEGLLATAGCDLPLLNDARRIRGFQYHVPKSVASQASVVRVRRGWIVSVSGGVDINCWSVLNRTESSSKLSPVRMAASSADFERWWWD